MKPMAFLYAEVPANEILDSIDVLSVTLIHPQHVHYFTLEHLACLFQVCGFRVLKQRVTVTNGIPRASVLVAKRDFEGRVSPLVAAQGRLERILRAAAQKIMYLVEWTDKVAIWGVGADLNHMLRYNLELKRKVTEDEVVLVDSFLYGREWLGCTIMDPLSLLNECSILVLAPKARHIRVEILNCAMSQGFGQDRFFDPYQEAEGTP